MARTEIYAQDSVDQPSGEAFGNATGVTSGTKRGVNLADLPISTAKSITPASNTDVNFTHRFVYAETAGDVTVRFAAGGTAYAIRFPEGGLLPMTVYSIDAYGGTGNVWLFN